MGTFDDATSNGLSAPPYLACFFYIIVVCWLSDRFKMRGPFCAFSALIAAIGFIVNATTTGTGPRYFSVFFSVQIFACVALLLAWTANIHATESKRAGGYTILATIGQCGPLLGTPSSQFVTGAEANSVQVPMFSQTQKRHTSGRACGSRPHSACSLSFLASRSASG